MVEPYFSLKQFVCNASHWKVLPLRLYRDSSKTSFACSDETDNTLISESTSLEDIAFCSKNIETGLHIKERHVTAKEMPAENVP